MKILREYTLELGWLLLVIVLFMAQASRTSASNWSYEDSSRSCEDASSWCEVP